LINIDNFIALWPRFLSKVSHSFESLPSEVRLNDLTYVESDLGQAMLPGRGNINVSPSKAVLTEELSVPYFESIQIVGMKAG
jgi:hypothetical protein